MPTKPRTKKPAAKPKRYVRVAVKAGKATLQESDQPDRGFKPPRQPKPTAEEIGRSIGDALGRRLEDLLAKPDLANRTMLHFSEERGGLDRLIEDAEAAYSKAYVPFNAGDKIAYQNHSRELTAKISPVDEALQRLRGEIAAAEVTTDIEMEKLDPLLAPVTPEAGGAGSAQQAPGFGQLAGILNTFAERIAQDNRRRNELLDRLEL